MKKEKKNTAKRLIRSEDLWVHEDRAGPIVYAKVAPNRHVHDSARTRTTRHFLFTAVNREAFCKRLPTASSVIFRPAERNFFFLAENERPTDRR